MKEQGTILNGTSLQKLAIKKMARTNEKEFINELRVLSTAHHANLVNYFIFFFQNWKKLT